MKRSKFFYWKLLLIVAIVYATGLSKQVFGQNPTGVCEVLQQPCTDDGVLVVTITSGMTLPLTFQYNGLQSITHSDINSFTDTLFQISAPGPYSVHVTDGDGNYLYLNTGLVSPFQWDYYQDIVNPVCPETMGTATITINSGMQPASVEWYESDQIDYSLGDYVGTGNPMSLGLGCYSVIVTDENGCSMISASYDTSLCIEAESSIDFSVVTTEANCTDGTATIENISGAVAPCTYQWQNGANTASISNLSEGYQYVTVYDAQGCSKTQYFNIIQGVDIDVNMVATSATCQENDGSVISFGSGGIPPYSYSYSNGCLEQEATGLTGNSSIQVTVTDVNGCRENGYKYIQSSTPISVSTLVNPSLCTAPTGDVTLSISGGTAPYTISWADFPGLDTDYLDNLAVGIYAFTVTDAVGCMRTGSVNISSDSYINAYIYTGSETCGQNDGYAYINAYTDEYPLTYEWSSGQTVSNIDDLESAFYTCTISNAVGCSVVKSKSVNVVPGYQITGVVTDASCIFNEDGSILVNVVGSTGPFTYNWTNGETTSNCTGLATGSYNLHVVDANGCHANKYFHVGYDESNDDCYCTITGTVFADLNDDCLEGVGEEGIENIMMHCSSMGYSYTDEEGVYSFIVPTGNYEISEQVQAYYPLASCQDNNIQLSVTASSGCVETLDFANAINPIHDMQILRTYVNHPIPGYEYAQRLVVKNNGTIEEPGIVLGFGHDGQLAYTNNTPLAYSQIDQAQFPDWYSVTSGFPTLQPGEEKIMVTNYHVPYTTPLNTIVQFFDTVTYQAPLSDWLIDYSPWNNVQQYNDIVIGSFDPNCIEVSPRGTGTPGFITVDDSVLTYVVHFQNTGTWYAQNIYVMDTLDSDLNIETVVPGFSDHDYTVTMSEDGVLRFDFENIMLPPESYGEIESSGMFTYSVKLKEGLDVGTEIHNTAAIFFDFNSPVITNTVVNTITDTLLTVEKNLTEQNVIVYPNPMNNLLNIRSEQGSILNSVVLYDLTGRVIEQFSNTNTEHYVINTEQLSPGIYLVAVTLESGKTDYQKVIKR